MTEQKKQKRIRDFIKAIGGWSAKVIQASDSGCPDILACVPVEVTPDMVGKKIGVFVAPEVKKKEGLEGSELQELRIEEINNAKGIAGVCVEPADLSEMIFDKVY